MKTDVSAAIRGLLDYAEERGLIENGDRTYCFNRLLQMLKLDAPDGEGETFRAELPELLEVLTDSAVERGLIADGVVSRDLYDSLLMDAVTPWPHEVRRRFAEKYSESPQAATDWFYGFSRDTNYIRRDRIARDRKWVYEGAYGTLDITINLSKPEKDPRAIAAAKLLPQTDY
ncbi:MAG: galactose-1-phosphate uridylyltransferase, partial [Oscillospiraceae bacterium]|nr:galactose-1-phosphate uridylyltransferase [Oscillospiraceae bacterium]